MRSIAGLTATETLVSPRLRPLRMPPNRNERAPGVSHTPGRVAQGGVRLVKFGRLAASFESGQEDRRVPRQPSEHRKNPPPLAPPVDSLLTYHISYAGRAGTHLPAPATSAQEWFLSKVERRDGCWLWTGPLFHEGYGCVCVSGRRQPLYAHRLSYELFIGPIPVGKSVLHRCDVKNCVDPAHLFLGTHADNMRDAAAKGRMPGGPGPKLTVQTVKQARQLRAEGVGYDALAEHFGVAWCTIWQAVNGVSWKHVH